MVYAYKANVEKQTLIILSPLQRFLLLVKDSKLVLLIICIVACICSMPYNGVAQSKKKDKAPKEKKAKKTKNSDRKANKGSSKPWNHSKGGGRKKQDMDKDNAGVTKKRGGRKPTTKANDFSTKKTKGSKTVDKASDRFSTKSSDRTKRPNTSADNFSAKSKNRTKKPNTDADNFSTKSKNRTKKPNTEADSFSAKSKNRTRKPNTDADSFTAKTKNRPKDYKQPQDLSKTKIKVPVIDHRKNDLKRYRNSDKLQTISPPPRTNKPNLNDTYMVKVKRKHGNQGLPKKNPVEWKLDRSAAKGYKNPRPDIARWQGNWKRPRRAYQRFLDLRKARQIQDKAGKLYTVRVPNDRKQYRKLGRKVALWRGDLKIKRMPKHAHPSMRWQFVKHRPSSAEIKRNRKVKKPKYDPNERKIWEPSEEYSTPK